LGPKDGWKNGNAFPKAGNQCCFPKKKKKSQPDRRKETRQQATTKERPEKGLQTTRGVVDGKQARERGRGLVPQTTAQKKSTQKKRKRNEGKENGEWLQNCRGTSIRAKKKYIPPDGKANQGFMQGPRFNAERRKGGGGTKAPSNNHGGKSGQKKKQGTTFVQTSTKWDLECRKKKVAHNNGPAQKKIFQRVKTNDFVTHRKRGRERGEQCPSRENPNGNSLE